MKAWLGVVSAEHVRRGVDLGIAQVCHGKLGPLARMRAGDTLIYYSAQERLGDKPLLRQFTALGVVSDEETWQAEEGDFRPFRRRVSFAAVTPVPLDHVRNDLDLTAGPNWGYQLRRGLLALSIRDATTLGQALLASQIADRRA